MEDVLEVYKLPYDPQRPLICMDELPKQLLADKQDSFPCQAGQPARQDYGYERHGVAEPGILSSRCPGAMVDA